MIPSFIVDTPLLHHGGRLREASQRFGIPLSDWVDLSTGISPDSYPLPAPPADIWLRLPEAEDGLIQAAEAYYWENNRPNNAALLPVAGSQAAIQILPWLRRHFYPTAKTEHVVLFSPSYAEHYAAWQRAQFALHTVNDLADPLVEQADVVVLVNPNNPTAERWSSQQLLQLHQQLQKRNGWLVVDEAFMDATPEHSVASHAGKTGLIILRSLGKFFGLAGARVGFVLAEQFLVNTLETALGPWSVNAPGRWAAQMALQDTPWQQQQRENLTCAALRLQHELAVYDLPISNGCPLFQWIPHPSARRWHEALAQRAILTRLFDGESALRIGLPSNEHEWLRLRAALDAVVAGVR